MGRAGTTSGAGVTAEAGVTVGAVDARGTIPLTPSHEHVIFAAFGTALAGGTELAPGSLLYLPSERESVAITARGGTRLFLLGGEPLGETLLMWWELRGPHAGRHRRCGARLGQGAALRHGARLPGGADARTAAGSGPAHPAGLTGPPRPGSIP